MALTAVVIGGARISQAQGPPPAQVAIADALARQKAQEEAEANAARERAAEMQAATIARLNDKTPLQVQVTVSRYTGDKKTSSMPYVLTVNAGASAVTLNNAENSRLRMGSQVPVPSPAFAPPVKQADGSERFQPLRTYNYQEIGTNIDCRARSMGDGRFELGISVEEKSVFTDVKDAAVDGASIPVIRSFLTSQNLILRNGESRQFTAATDRVTGEVVRIDVMLTVVK
jgi:hypothetical protein